MELYFIKSIDTKIEDKPFYKIAIYDFIHLQTFFIYKSADNQKAKQFILKHKPFDNVTQEITFAIKSDKKISLDIK